MVLNATVNNAGQNANLLDQVKLEAIDSSWSIDCTVATVGIATNG